ncbi:hypothetical protein EMCG_02345 [[Emmonsia] crescens]|uniref:Uncharacterized protein n=1 Tax=[Emmonsia] crescens TaxID=73230 RepID=A0A0G2J1M2_9EURO|nr:hypothetical protein EMCG_02345 [Emmonsia crescens UAMH 3008]
MSPRSPYRQRDSFSMSNRPRSPAPTFVQTPRQEGDDNDPAAFLYKWIKSDRPRLSRPVSSYSGTKTEQVYNEMENNKLENKLPLEQALVHKEFHIEALRGQMRKLISENAAECSRLNDKINGLQVQLVSLRTRLQASESDLEIADGARAELEEEVKELRRAFVEKSEALEGHEKKREEEIKELQRIHRGVAGADAQVDQRKRSRMLSASESDLEIADGARAELEEEVKELRRAFVEKSEALEGHEKKREEEVNELQRILAEKSKTLEVHERKREEEVNELQRRLAEKSEALESHERKREEEVTELQQRLAEKSEALESHKKERDEEVEELRQTLAERSEALECDIQKLEEEYEQLKQNFEMESEALECHNMELEEEITQLRRALAKKSEALEGNEQEREEEVKDLQQALTETSEALQHHKQELDERVNELQRALVESSEALKAREQELGGEVSELRLALADKSKALEELEQAKWEALTAQKVEMEEHILNTKEEDSRMATEQLEQQEKTLVAQLNEKHTTELENLQTSFAAELQHIQNAHAAAVQEFIDRLELKSEKRREGNHLVGLLGGKLSRNRNKGTIKDKGDSHIRALCREILHVGRFRSRKNSCEQSRKSESRRDSGVHCSCACTNTLDRASLGLNVV